MRTKAIDRQIFRLAIPNILGNLSVPLLSSVDTALVGHLPSPVYIGAVALGGMIFNFIYWGFGFLRMGTTGLTAQAFGEKNTHETHILLQRAVLIAFLTGFALILLQGPIAYVSFWLIHGSPQIEQLAKEYFFIRIFAAPATLGLYAIHGWFLGMQNARFPLIVTIAVNVLNIIFDFLFVLVFKMNSDGVALGTVLAQYLGLLLTLVLLSKYYRTYLKPLPVKTLLALKPMRRFIAVNTDIFIRTLSLIFAFSFFTAQSAGLGEIPLAANSILIQFWMFFSYAIDGFAFAAESLVGKFVGSGEQKHLVLSVRRIFLFGILSGVMFSVVYLLLRNLLPVLFTNDAAVLQTIARLIPWTILAPLVASVCYIWDGIFIGATATRGLRNAMVVSTFVIYLPAHYLFLSLWQIQGMWAALLLFMLARGLGLTVLSKKYLGLSPRLLLPWTRLNNKSVL